MKQRVASVSMDLDNQWSYMKTHGDEGWQSFPGYLDTAVPRFLEFFRRHDIQITVFVVGQDAVLESNQSALRSIAEAGHEIGNHSFHHEPWLHLYTDDQLREEIESAEEAIHQVTGQRPRGFRGPGFSYSDRLIRLLAERGYQYDASTFPTFLGPVARAWYFLRSRFSEQEKEDRKQLFGKFRDGFQPLRPYLWDIGERQLLEIPVTTMPLFKLPIHASYVMYLAGYSKWLARFYFRVAIQMCRMARVQPSLLLHPLDFMDVEDVPELEFFPAMDVPRETKHQLLDQCLNLMQKHWQLVPMHRHAEAALVTPTRKKQLATASVPSRSDSAAAGQAG